MALIALRLVKEVLCSPNFLPEWPVHRDAEDVSGSV